ncbi:MAG: pilus assembly FimT family protein [Candidatus Aminicenantaceae bacterium]
MKITPYRKDKFKKIFNMKQKGFSLIEAVIVIAVLGMMVIFFYPNITGVREKRQLENAAKEILLTMQQAKIQAVKTKLDHRVRFNNDTGKWIYMIEREDTAGAWALMPGFIKKTIPAQFTATINLPNKIATFSPMGFNTDFSAGNNTVSIQSAQLQEYGHPGYRTINIYAGGAVEYYDPQTEE